MIEGSTVIFNEQYIEELTRHRDYHKKRFETEDNPYRKQEYQKSYENFENKLTEALDFQDTIQDVINIDVPRITVIRTINGVVLPLRNIKVI